MADIRAVLKALIVKTITFNLAEEQGILEKMLLLGGKLLGGGSDPYHVLRRFT